MTNEQEKVKDRIKELKAALKEFKKQCKKCDRYECGYCAEPKLRMAQEIESLECAIGGTHG